MGCHVRWSDKLGANFGRKFTIFILVVSSLYLAIGLAFTLTARLYLRSYYNGAHMAGLSVFIALSVLSHHLFKLNKALSCSTKPFFVVQSIVNIWAFLCLLAASVAYTILVATDVHVNDDYVTSLVFGWLDVLLMLYLLVVTLTSACTTWHFSYDVDYGGDIPMNAMDTKYQNGGVSSRNPKDSRSGSHARGFKLCCSVLFGMIHTVFLLLLSLVLFLSAYYPVTVLVDISKFRNTSELYTVQVDGHKPLSLFLRCRGNGTETIVYENGLGGLALMGWDFIPKHLEKKYRNCVYDRRGHGWSEGSTYDHIDSEEQWAKTNVAFLKELVKVANIPTPFFYAGHSYGGVHISYGAHLYPNLIKGLVFFDTVRFSPLGAILDVAELISNFKPLGLAHIAFETGLLDWKYMLRNSMDVDATDTETMDTLVASLRSGYYIETMHRESETFEDTDFNGVSYGSAAAARLNEDLGTNTIDKPLLVIDADGIRTFPRQLFSKYEDLFHLAVDGANHVSLIYGTPYSSTVANLMDIFIQLTNGQIGRAEYTLALSKISGVHNVNSNATIST